MSELTPEAMTDARMDAIGIVQAFINRSHDPDDIAVKTLIDTSDHEPWQLLVSLAGLTAAIIDQISPVLDMSADDYLTQLRAWVLAAEHGQGDAQ